jgi:hypothetical protein
VDLVQLLDQQILAAAEVVVLLLLILQHNQVMVELAVQV